MIDFLKKPYPAHTADVSSLYLAIGAGLFIGLFLVFFQPFDLDEVSGDFKYIKIFGFGIVTFIGVAFFNFVLPRLFPSFSDDKTWTVGKEILFLNGMLLTIALLNSLYNPILSGSNKIDLPSFLFMCVNTFSIGIIPSAFFVAIDYSRLLKKHVADSQAINLHEENPVEISPQQIKIKADNKEIIIDPNTFLYAESVGNYANILTLNGDQLQKDLYRSTLKNLEENIEVKGIIRCHRSFIINLEQVKEVSGNAQGFKLSLKNANEIIPVSRKYVPVVKAYFS